MDRRYFLLLIAMFFVCLTASLEAQMTGNYLIDTFDRLNRYFESNSQINPLWGNHASAEELFFTGQNAFMRGDYYTAVQYLLEFIRQYPNEHRVADANWLIAESYRSVKNYTEALNYYRRLLTINHQNAHHAAYLMGWCMYKMGNYHNAITELHNFINRFPYSNFAGDAWYKIGRSNERISRIPRAIDAYKEVITKYNNSSFYFEANERYNYLLTTTDPDYPLPPDYPHHPPPGESAYDLYRRGHTELSSGNYRNAIVYFERVLRYFSSSEWADDALFWKAESQYELKSYTDSIKNFERFINVYPHSKHYVTARFRLPMVQMEFGRIQLSNRQYLYRAAENFASFQHSYTNHREAATALYNAGLCMEIVGDYNSAVSYWQRVIDLYPHSPAYRLAKDKIDGLIW